MSQGEGGGRPVEWTEEKKQWAVDEVCRALPSSISVRKIIENRQDLPTKSQFFLWLAENEKFSDQYARAKAAQTEFLLDEVPDIADESIGDYDKLGDGEGGPRFRFNGEHVQRSKLRVDSRLKLAEKLAPKKYGVTRSEVSGPDGGPIEIKGIAALLADAHKDANGR